MPVQVCLNSAIVSAERDGYFDLRQSLTGVFGDAVQVTFYFFKTRAFCTRSIDIHYSAGWRYFQPLQQFEIAEKCDAVLPAMADDRGSVEVAVQCGKDVRRCRKGCG